MECDGHLDCADGSDENYTECQGSKLTLFYIFSHEFFLVRENNSHWLKQQYKLIFSRNFRKKVFSIVACFKAAVGSCVKTLLA